MAFEMVAIAVDIVQMEWYSDNLDNSVECFWMDDSMEVVLDYDDLVSLWDDNVDTLEGHILEYCMGDNVGEFAQYSSWYLL